MLDLDRELWLISPKNHSSCFWSYNCNSDWGSGHHLRVSIFSVCCKSWIFNCILLSVKLLWSHEFVGQKNGKYLLKVRIPLEWEWKNPGHLWNWKLISQGEKNTDFFILPTSKVVGRLLNFLNQLYLSCWNFWHHILKLYFNLKSDVFPPASWISELSHGVQPILS